MFYYCCTCHKLSCRSPVNYVEVQAMFGTVIIYYPVARKRKAQVGIAGRQLCWKLGLFWALHAWSSAEPVLKKQSQKHLWKKMTFHSTASDRHMKSKQVPAKRLLCTCLPSRSLQNKLRDNKMAHAGTVRHIPTPVPSIPPAWCTIGPKEQLTEVIP